MDSSPFTATDKTLIEHTRETNERTTAREYKDEHAVATGHNLDSVHRLTIEDTAFPADAALLSTLQRN